MQAGPVIVIMEDEQHGPVQNRGDRAQFTKVSALIYLLYMVTLYRHLRIFCRLMRVSVTAQYRIEGIIIRGKTEVK